MTFTFEWAGFCGYRMVVECVAPESVLGVGVVSAGHRSPLLSTLLATGAHTAASASSDLQTALLDTLQVHGTAAFPAVQCQPAASLPRHNNRRKISKKYGSVQEFPLVLKLRDGHIRSKLALKTSYRFGFV